MATNNLSPDDFYEDENGLVVFTREYHLKRGFCCKSNCKHCPYNCDDANPDVPIELQMGDNSDENKKIEELLATYADEIENN